MDLTVREASRAGIEPAAWLYQLMQRHGGRLWFESEEGKGSTFSFSLALAESGDEARH